MSRPDLKPLYGRACITPATIPNWKALLQRHGLKAVLAACERNQPLATITQVEHHLAQRTITDTYRAHPATDQQAATERRRTNLPRAPRPEPLLNHDPDQIVGTIARLPNKSFARYAIRIPAAAPSKSATAASKSNRAKRSDIPRLLRAIAKLIEAR